MPVAIVRQSGETSQACYSEDQGYASNPKLSFLAFHFSLWNMEAPILPEELISNNQEHLKSSSEDQELSVTWAAFQFLSHFVNWKFIKQDKCEGQSISLQVRGFSWLKPTSHLSNRPHVELACRSTGKHRPWPGQDKPNAFIIQCENCRFVITYPRKWKVDHFSINS